MKFIDKWPEYEKFKAGDQWPAPTEKTKNLPRPVFNVISYIENHKICSVQSSQIKMVFTSAESGNQEAEQQAQLFTQYSESTCEKLKQNQLNEEALESASNLGTGIWHYYWDNAVEGGMNYSYIGEMKGETIDPMNFFPGNPQQIRVQLQPYIIISSRDLVSNIKEEAKKNSIPMDQIENIVSDKPNDEDYEQAKKEVNDSDKATVLTKYWRDTETKTIWFMKVCGNVVIKESTDTEMKLYPIAVMNWYKRKKCIFGIGDTEGLIPNQKLVNFLIAMQALSVQLTGFPKLMYNPQFIKQRPTNTPGEVIANYDPNGADHMKYIMPGAISPVAKQLVDVIMENTKNLSGATETSTGELSKSSQMNATAINLLQQAASVPIDGIRKRFYQAMEDVALIWEQFWKIYYNTDRQFTGKDEQGNPTPQVFNGANAQGIEFNLKIDVTEETPYSEGNIMNSLNSLFEKGHIDLIQYLTHAPKSVIPFKDQLIKDIQQKQAEAANQPQQPTNVPSSSISYKDLPTAGQIQLAQQIGVQLTEQDIMQNKLMDQQIQQHMQEQQIMNRLNPAEQAALNNAHPDQRAQILRQLNSNQGGNK